jgi:CBS domain-containing protein
MTVRGRGVGERRRPRIPTRVAATLGGMETLRSVARSMMESGLGAALVENPAGPMGLVTATNLIEALAGGADPDLVWVSEIMRPVPRIVSRRQDPAVVGEEMAAYELEVVTVVDEDSPLGLASALDVLGAVVRATKQPRRRLEDSRHSGV